MPVLLAQNNREVKKMVYSFRGGIHPGTHADPGYKSATNTKPIEKLALPDGFHAHRRPGEADRFGR